MLSQWKKVRRLEKGTPPPVVAVVTIMRYACETVGLVNLESKFELVSTALVSLREAPPKKKRVHLGIAQKGGGGSKRLPKLFLAVLQ